MTKKSIELTVNSQHSKDDDCVCCEGNHRYSTFLTDADGKQVEAGRLAHDVARELNQGHKIKVTVEILN